jgi:signal transduction histidine kinase
MAQMGELIGNIAHQWRQPLSVISTAASGMKIKKELQVLDDEDFFHYADSILNNVTFLSDTIDEFRDYIKESHREKEIIVQDRVKMAFKMVETSYSIENIKIIEDIMEKEPIKFKLILGELLQVIIAILNNAREALSAKKSSEKWLKYSVYKDEHSVIITIEDNAGGIKEEIMDKVFNPYFTTKHQSHGTGIGLYSSYDIVVNHLGGTLDVENSEHGAKFFIKLPLNLNYTI